MDRKLRRILLRYLRSGRLSVEEISYIGAVRRQSVYKWCRKAGIDLVVARRRYIAALARRIHQEAEAQGVPWIRRVKRGQAKMGPVTPARPRAKTGA